MRYKFVLQDPTDLRTSYLYEDIVAELDRSSTTEWRAIFAFVSEQGVNALLEDPAVRGFLDRDGSIDLVVGIDAVTDARALRRLRELEVEYDNVEVRVFHNRSRGLFHPKVAHFTRRDSSQVVITGSGNLTPGGLRGNIEGFSVVTAAPDEPLDLEMWNSFLQRHAPALRPIDDDALERAERNRQEARLGRRREVEPQIEAEEEPEGADRPAEPEEEALRDDRMLVAEIPKAGGRWHQLHFNRDVVEQFFRVKPDSAQRVFLREVLAPGRLGPVEARKCVFSRVNRNHRIEFAARRGEAYPTRGRPLLVARETGLRTFQYMILLPGEQGHAEMTNFIARRPSIGRGTKRVVATRRELLGDWPGSPV